MSPYLDLVRERIVVFDGAGGTYLQRLDLTADDFGGEALEGCNELLCDTRPDAIRQMHADYFASGADVVETNSFGSFRVPLAEYGLEDIAAALAHANREGRGGKVLLTPSGPL